jgi:hypothetical protein
MYFLRLLAQSTPYAKQVTLMNQIIELFLHILPSNFTKFPFSLFPKQGFFCNDNEIRFPYVPDTFPAYLMDWAFAIVCPLVVSVFAHEIHMISFLHFSASPANTPWFAI